MRYGLGKFVEPHFFSFIHPTLGFERTNFHDGTSKRYVEPWIVSSILCDCPTTAYR